MDESMHNIEIRNVEAKDIPMIKEVIAKVWNWTDLIEDNQTLDAVVGIYLNQVLYEATFGRVAVLNNKVVGVIFGSVDGIEPKYRMLLENCTNHTLTLLAASESDRINTFEYLSKLSITYQELISDYIDNYDGTLDFLVLSKESHGLGIGKSLWMALKSYFDENNAKSIYLYSDVECNYGFYEHFGFARKAEKEVIFKFNEEDYKMNIFLYDIAIPIDINTFTC
ncbi:MAG: GNAT family N-acetyltransferase [Defluviitaleaceae bacterium]|nr:GNAT family N-acetyltransferase [Defluviitaleaceae bacterium]